ncbi:MAG: hypothetical protein UHS41_07620 [Lachnospiraceae bacterium]|nr:hypothetical protein [Lachnospiraceae bacterium]
MSETVIKVENLTKDYGKNRGIFQVNLDIKQGEIYGIYRNKWFWKNNDY